MWNMSCIWCQDMRVPLPQPPPPPFINYSQIELVQVGAKAEGERRDHGSAAVQYKCCTEARLRGPHQRLYALPRSCLQSAKEAARHPFP